MVSVSFFTWTDTNEYWDNMLEQEHYLADYYPRNASYNEEVRAFRKREEKGLPQETRYMAKRQYHAIQALQGWCDQRKVASWALNGLKEGWHIHVAHDEHNIPLYYFILCVSNDKKSVEMKGLWRSIYGSLYNLSCGKDAVKGKAMDLVKWSLRQHKIISDATVTVSAQIGLVKLFRKNGFELPFTSPFPEDLQGFSEPTLFIVSNVCNE